MQPKFLVIAAVVACCWSMCFAREPAPLFIDGGSAEPGVAELQDHIRQLTSRVERLEAQLVRVAEANAAVQFTCDRPILDSNDKNQNLKLSVPGEIDEGMMIDAIERGHRRRASR